MGATDRFQLVVESVTRGESQLRNFEGALNKFADSVDRAANRTKTASAKSDEDLKKFAASVKNAIQNPLDALGNGVEKFILRFGKMGVVTSAAAVGFGIVAKQAFDLTRALGQSSEQMQNLADRTGLSLGQIDKLRAQAKIAGVSIESLSTASRTLADFLDDTSSAGEQTRQTLRELGVSFFESTGAQRNFGDVTLELIQKLSRLDDQQKLLVTTQKLFGRGAIELLPLIRQFATTQQAVERLGFGLDENLLNKTAAAGDKIDILELKWEKLKRSFAVPAIAVVDIVTRIAEAFEGPRQAPTFDPKNPRAAVSHGGGVPRDPLLLALEHARKQDQRRLSEGFRITERSTEAGVGQLLDDLGKQRANLRNRLLSGDLAAGAFQSTIAELRRVENETDQLERELKRIRERRGLSEFEARETGPSIRPSRAPSLFGAGARSLPNLPTFSVTDDQLNQANAGRIAASADQMKARLQGIFEAEQRGRERILRTIEQQTDFEARRIQLLAGLGGELEAIQKITALKLASLEQQKLLGADLFEIEQRRAQILQEAEIERLNVQRQRVEEFRTQAGQVFDALTARGRGGLKDFFGGQLKLLERQIFINASAGTFEKFGGALGKIGAATGLGGLLKGTIFDPQNANPIQKNTSSLDRLTGSVDRLVVTMGGGALPGVPGLPGGIIPGIGVPGGTPTFTGAPITLGTTGRFGRFTTGLGSALSGPFAGLSSTDRSIQLSPGVATTASALGINSGAGRVGNVVGSAAILAGGTFGVLSGIRQGGVRGGLNAASSGLGTAAALDPEPVSKAILAIAALAAGMFGGLLGDPKAKRDQKLNELIERNRYSEPMPSEFNFDTAGRTYDFDARGGMRPMNVYVTVPVQAMDSRSFVEHSEDIGNAVRAAIFNGHPVNRAIREAAVGI